MDDNLLRELIGDHKKGQLVRLNPSGVFDYPYIKDQLAIVTGHKKEKRHYRDQCGVWVWLQKDQMKALLDPWDLLEVEDAEEDG